MIINADLHVHSKYSMATSKNMDPSNIALESQRKGLDLVATGDALHSKWLGELEETLEPIDDTGIYRTNDSVKENTTHFVTTTEVEDNERIHHLILIPSISVAWQMRDEFKVKNMDADGRPRIRMGGDEIMDIARDYDCIIGPAHIFTPWTGLYKSYDSIIDCYGSRPDFVELGLSSDSHLADLISELGDYTFLTNSDSHSPWPHRIGREFNSMSLDDLSFESLRCAIRNNDIVENYGFDPRMGKYHETGCIKCYKIYSISEALERDMKCSCGGRIKKGVKGRIQQLATYDEPHHPTGRPHYQYLLPLAELLSTVHGKGVMTKYVQTRYDKLLKLFGSEIDVLLNTSLDDIGQVDVLLANILRSYRDNTLEVDPGRGGRYGSVEYK
ncbi:MAG: TIGR00375 family protein [Methanosphaera sp.]|nr:TIGR00375 family protein [Methanosphaera sp.]